MSEAYGSVSRWVTAVFPLGFREEGRPSLFWDLWQQYVITAVLFMAACFFFKFSSFLVSLFPPPNTQRISTAAKGSVPVIHHLKVQVNKLYEWMIHSGTKCKQILCKLLSMFVFKRGASSLIHQPVSHWKRTGFVWMLFMGGKKNWLSHPKGWLSFHYFIHINKWFVCN